MTELSECCQDYKNVSGTCEGIFFTVILNKIAIKYKGNNYTTHKFSKSETI